MMVIPKPLRGLAEELLSLHGRIIHAFLSPILFPLALLYRGVESSFPGGGLSRVVKKAGFGVVGAVHAGAVQAALMAVAVAVGFGAVQVWVEEPVVLQDSLHLDFRHATPQGVLTLQGTDTIPVGHNFHVSLLLVMPESPYNRQLGMFQVSAELLTRQGEVIVRSSQPCMLRFRSAPVRLARTLLMALPLLFGLSDEMQQIQLHGVLKHREGVHPRIRSGGIRVTLSPRAGKRGELPELYEAKLVVKSEPPWIKEVVRRWKWTLSVWTSICLYLTLLLMLLCCLRAALFTPFVISVLFAATSTSSTSAGEGGGDSDDLGLGIKVTRSSSSTLSASEVIRRIQQRRRKRSKLVPEETASNSSTVTTSTGAVVEEEEEVGDAA